MRLRASRWVALVVVLLLPVTLSAQEATLTGTITDTTGAVLPGVVVQAVHEESGNSFEAVTDSAGAFRLALRVGAYRMSASLAGFAPLTRTGLQVRVGQQLVVNLEMSPATLQESVTVTGEAPLIDVTSSSLAGNIDPRQMQDLPVLGRNWMNLTMLAPGSRLNAVGEVPTVSQATSIGFQLNLDGQQVTQTVATGFGQPRYSRDAIAEFEFISNRFDASQGRSMGVQVNAVTKSGTNMFAGTFAGYFRSDRFNAADPVVGKVLPYSNQQLSATAGGPIRRDKFHFFGSYEYEREPQTYTYTTPYPRFNGALTGTRREFKELGRLDYQFSPRMRLSVRGSRYDNLIPYDSRYVGGSDKTMSSAIGTNRRSDQVVASLTRVLGTGSVNELKAGHSMFRWNQYSHVRNPNSLPGQTAGRGAPSIQFQGFTVGQSHQLTPHDILDEFYSVRDDLSFSFVRLGRHDAKAGGEYVDHFLRERVCNQCMGVLNVQGGPVPANVESLFPDIMDVSTWNLTPLSPITRFYQRQIAMDTSPYSRPAGNHGLTMYLPRDVYGFWLQDDWHLGRTLTLNLGLRYDLDVGAFVNWVDFPPFFSGNRPQDTNNFGPRLGFAYSVRDRTVVRGGYGKYFGDVSGTTGSFTLRAVQSITPQILNDGRPDFAPNPFNGPAPTYDQAERLLCYNNGNRPGCLRRNMGSIIGPDLEMPYSHQASIGLAHQVGPVMSVEADFVYTGERAVHRDQSLNLAYNPATGANYPFNDVSRLPYPDWGVLTMRRADGKNDYRALQAALTKRMSNRWQASATYTLSGEWTFDNLSLAPGCRYPLIAPGVCDVPFTVAPDIAENTWVSTGAQRHRVTFNGIWDAWYGIQLSGLYIFGDEGWLTANSGVDVRQNGSSGGRLRPNGTLIPRNGFDKPSIHRVDLRLQRRLHVTGRASVDGQLEIFNLFNRANYETFVLNERNARYGLPQPYSNVAYAPRILQLGFRVQF